MSFIDDDHRRSLEVIRDLNRSRGTLKRRWGRWAVGAALMFAVALGYALGKL